MDPQTPDLQIISDTLANQTLEYYSVNRMKGCDEMFSTALDGTATFLHSSWIFMGKDGFWFGQAPVRKADLTTKFIMDNQTKIQGEDMFPEWTRDMTPCTISPGELYVRRPRITNYAACKGTGKIRRMLLQEARVFEQLKRHPHPNIVSYHGYYRKEKLLVALGMEKIPFRLEERLADCNGYKKPIDGDACWKMVAAALGHLHSLGLALNYLDPAKIMVRDDDTIVLVNLGTCCPVGEEFMKSSVRAFWDMDDTTSAFRNDEILLHKLRDWLKEHEQSRRAHETAVMQQFLVEEALED